ncbi:MAG: hypothetical protein ACE147_00835 [Candidatus Methylomirabilales bacterium]
MSNGNGETTVLEASEILTPSDIQVPAITNTAEIEALAQRYAVEAQGDLRLAEACTVTDDASYEQAGQLRVAIDRKKKGGEGVVELVCGPLYQRWKAFRELLTAPVKTREQAVKLLSDKRLAYQREQERKAEEARLEAERRAREEQERLDKLAKDRAEAAERKAREEAEKAEAIRREAEAAAAREKDAARAAEIRRQAEEAAVKAEAKAAAAMEKAEAILESVPQVTPQPAMVFNVPQKTAGIAKNVYWHAAIIGTNHGKYADAIKGAGPMAERARQSFLQLVTAVAAGEVPLDALLPNESWLNKTAASLKKAMKYPGVEVWDTEQEKSTGR